MIPLALLTFENVRHAWLWLGLIAAGAWLLFMTYRGIFERSEQRLTWALMVLRGAGLLALVLALAKPTWTRESEQVDPGRVGLVLDDSVSMSLRDPSGKTRFVRASELAERFKKSVEESGRPRVAVDLFDIAGRPLVDRQRSDEPRNERTDLGKALSDAVRQLRSKPLVGVVLVSDGVDNSGQQGLAGIEQLGVPIYTVGFDPDPSAGRYDLAIRSVTAPERVMVNNDVNVELLVVKTGQSAAEVELQVRRGRDSVATKKLSLPEGDSEQRVTVPIKPTEAGSFVFTAAVKGDADERLLANNSQHFPLRVDAEAIRVFYIEGFLRWEYTYLRRQLEADPDISAVTAVRRPNPETAGSDAPGDLLTADRLENLDVVLLGDTERMYLTPSEYQALISWIDAGKSLLVLGGYHSFGPDGFRNSPLADVLPVIFDDGELPQLDEPFRLELTDAGRQHPIFSITGDRVQDAAVWATAPTLSGCSVVKGEKPGATVLAVNPTSDSALRAPNSALPVLITHRYGKGHVAVLTADTTWRWTRLTRVLGQSDTLYSRFWGQMIRWLAGKELNDDRPALAVSTDRPDYESGKKVTLCAVRQPRPGDSGGDAHVNIEILDESGKSIGVQMAASSAEPDVFTGSFYPTSGGRYEAHATLAVNGQQTANQTAEFLVHGSALELADTGTKKELLRDLALKTGGLYYDIDQADKLAEKIERRERRITRVVRTEFWDSPLLFLGFLAAVTAEWVIRRRNHLV
jgi:uncharacterized membrane protein